MSTLIEMQDSFLSSGKKALQILDSFKEIHLEKAPQDPEIKGLLTTISREIDKGIKKIETTLSSLLDNAEWENINIGFFGETNAGKSTLIETLTKGDGNSIGDGSKDYTKQLNQVTYAGIQFFDMPGIEGNETSVQEEIKRAVEKCHIIFYILRADKQPEKPTMLKIRGYLRDNAKVYSIMNISGAASTYKYVQELVRDDLRRVEKDSIQAFKQTLAGHYRTNTMTQGHLAFLSRGNPVREDLLTEQRKAEAIFSNRHDMIKFSRFESIETILANIGDRGSVEIVVSNYYKLLRDMESTLGRILHEKKVFDEVVRKFQDIFYIILEEVEELFDKKIVAISGAANIFFDRLQRNLTETAYKTIENGESEKVIRANLDKTLHASEAELKDLKNQMASELEKDIERLIEKFKEEVSIAFRKDQFKTDIDIRAIIEQVQISFQYTIKQLFDLGLSLWAAIPIFAVFGPWGAAIFGVLVGARKVLELFVFDKKKRMRRAKERAYREIKMEIGRIKNEHTEKLSSELKRIKRIIKQHIRDTQQGIKDFRAFSIGMDRTIQEFTDNQAQTFTLLARYLFGGGVKMGYIDLQLQQACLVGTGLNGLDFTHLRLAACTTYPTLDKFMEDLDHQCEGDLLILQEKDEFKKRAANAFRTKIGCKRITRRMT